MTTQQVPEPDAAEVERLAEVCPNCGGPTAPFVDPIGDTVRRVHEPLPVDEDGRSCHVRLVTDRKATEPGVPERIHRLSGRPDESGVPTGRGAITTTYCGRTVMPTGQPWDPTDPRACQRCSRPGRRPRPRRAIDAAVEPLAAAIAAAKGNRRVTSENRALAETLVAAGWVGPGTPDARVDEVEWGVGWDVIPGEYIRVEATEHIARMNSRPRRGALLYRRRAAVAAGPWEYVKQEHDRRVTSWEPADRDEPGGGGT